MPEKTTKELADESKKHSDKSLELFKEADEMYEEIKDMPRSPEREEALMAVLAKDEEAMAEANKAMEINQEFINQIRSEE